MIQVKVLVSYSLATYIGAVHAAPFHQSDGGNMPISNAHLLDTCQVWDGLTYDVIPTKEANKLEKQGLVQKTNNISAAQLKTAAEFDVARQKIADKQMKVVPPGLEPKKVDKRSKAYRDKMMKAESDGNS